MPLGFIGENVIYCHLEILYLRVVSMYCKYESSYNLEVSSRYDETNSICLTSLCNRQEILFSVNLKGSSSN